MISPPLPLQGFLYLWGVRDYAGGIVVHISAGFAALASIFVVGSRQYESEEHRLAQQARLPVCVFVFVFVFVCICVF